MEGEKDVLDSCKLVSRDFSYIPYFEPLLADPYVGTYKGTFRPGSGRLHKVTIEEEEEAESSWEGSDEGEDEAVADTPVVAPRVQRARKPSQKAQELLSTKASMPEGQAQLVNEEAQEEETRSPLKKKSKAAAAKAVVRAANPAKVPAVLLQSLAAIQKILAVAKALEAATVKKGEGVQQAGCLVGEREGRQGMQQPSRCSRMQTKRQAVPLQACLQAQRYILLANA
ncbi:TPA: hypothetical protein ACH3X1_011507 [Trebouxia sp. C0004]